MTENIILAKAEIQRIADALRAMLGDEQDEQLILDCLEGETSLFELVRAMLGHIETDEGIIAALKQQIEDRNSRKARAEHRIECARNAIGDLLAAARIDKLALPEATVSTRMVPGRPKVSDADLLPEDMCRIERKPDMKAIKEAMDSGRSIPGVTLSNGSVSLTIRKK